MQLRFDHGDTELAAALAELDARFGRDLSALWLRLVDEVRDTASVHSVYQVGGVGNAALALVCEKAVHLFADILARNGRGEVILRALEYERRRNGVPAVVRIVADPNRS